MYVEVDIFLLGALKNLCKQSLLLLELTPPGVRTSPIPGVGSNTEKNILNWISFHQHGIFCINST